MAEQQAEQYYLLAIAPRYYEDTDLQQSTASNGSDSGDSKSKLSQSTGVSGNVTGHTQLQVMPDLEQLNVQPYLEPYSQPYSEAASGPVPSEDVTGPRGTEHPPNHVEWAQVPEQCHSFDNRDNNMESHPPLPHTVSEVASWEFTSLHNSSMAPASLSFQSDPKEQVLFRNPGLNIPADITFPSPCTDDIEVDDARMFKPLPTSRATVTVHQQLLENKPEEITSSSLPCSHYLCKKCNRERINAMLIPCHHVGLCMGCACRIMKFASLLSSRCPFCDEPVVGVESVHLT